LGNNKENQEVRRSAGAMAVGTLGSRILGLVRDIVLAALFPNFVKDAFVVAFRLPNLFRRLLGEGSLSVSFIPVYVDQNETSGIESGQALAGAIWCILMMVTSILSVLGILFMPQIIELLVPGKQYQAIVGKVDLTILLARVMFLYLFLVTSYAFLMAICQSHKKFFLPALAPAFFNLMVILFAVVPNEIVGTQGLQLALGVVFGGGVQAAIVIWQLRKIKKLPRPHLNLKTPGLKKVLINMLPGMAGLGVIQFIGIINVIFASQLEQGSHTYIYFADRILELPMSLIAISLGAALLPQLSAQWARGDVQQMHFTALSQMKLLFFLSIPCAIGMYLLAEPIVVMLFKRGEFNSTDVEQTMRVIQIYSYMLLASSMVRVLAPSFYAIKNTWYPALVSAICVLVHMVLASQWVDQWGLQGIVYSLVVTGFVNASLLLAGYFRFIGKFPIFDLITYWLKLIVPSVVMVGVLLGILHFVNLLQVELRFLSAFIIVIIGGGLSVLAYSAMAYVFKSEEVVQIVTLFRRKLLRK
tara:strand:- start:66972 stop:68555 length:1584 start_codon:yes stop_codon:yes gene_type:complete